MTLPVFGVVTRITRTSSVLNVWTIPLFIEVYYHHRQFKCAQNWSLRHPMLQSFLVAFCRLCPIWCMGCFTLRPFYFGRRTPYHNWHMTAHIPHSEAVYFQTRLHPEGETCTKYKIRYEIAEPRTCRDTVGIATFKKCYNHIIVQSSK